MMAKVVDFLVLSTPAKVAAVAARDGDDTVGFAIADIHPPGWAKLRTLSVEPDRWGRGIGTELCAALEARIVALGGRRLEAMFESAGASPAARVAAKRGFIDSQPRTLVCRGSARILEAPWVRATTLRGFEIFPWQELDAERRAQLEAEGEGWYPRVLTPFPGEPFEPINSLGLARNGRVVGWMITHRVAPAVIRYTSLFIRAEHRGVGPGMALLIEAVRRQDRAGIPVGVFGVGVANEEMVRLVEKRLAPWLDEIKNVHYVAKTLSLTQPGA